MREEFIDPTIRLDRQALEYILQIAVRIVSVELGGLDETHYGGGRVERKSNPAEHLSVRACHNTFCTR